jgi:hypothetical protein
MLFYYNLESADLVLGWRNTVSGTAGESDLGVIMVDCIYYYFLGAFSRCTL